MGNVSHWCPNCHHNWSEMTADLASMIFWKPCPACQIVFQQSQQIAASPFSSTAEKEAAQILGLAALGVAAYLFIKWVAPKKRRR